MILPGRNKTAGNKRCLKGIDMQWVSAKDIHDGKLGPFRPFTKLWAKWSVIANLITFINERTQPHNRLFLG